MVPFKHDRWREPVKFLRFCSTNCATFLLRLRSLLEPGKGAAWPSDVRRHELR